MVLSAGPVPCGVLSNRRNQLLQLLRSLYCALRATRTGERGGYVFIARRPSGKTVRDSESANSKLRSRRIYNVPSNLTSVHNVVLWILCSFLPQKSHLLRPETDVLSEAEPKQQWSAALPDTSTAAAANCAL